MKKAIDLVWIFVTVLISWPIYIYLTYQIMVRIEATEVMWFLYWVYVPIIILLGTLRAMTESVLKP